MVNAGILDAAFALKWVQKHIVKFGGDATKVTISGESAGAGAVMLLAIAKGGTLGKTLFKNVSWKNSARVDSHSHLDVGHRSISVSASTVRLQRHGTHTVLF